MELENASADQQTPPKGAPEDTDQDRLKKIDLDALASKLYVLFKEELRVERERVGDRGR
jgi:hypothetical protein